VAVDVVPILAFSPQLLDSNIEVSSNSGVLPLNSEQRPSGGPQPIHLTLMLNLLSFKVSSIVSDVVLSSPSSSVDFTKLAEPPVLGVLYQLTLAPLIHGDV